MHSRSVLPPHGRAKDGPRCANQPLISAWAGISIPNFGDWRRGDVILVEADSTLLGRGLRGSQAVSLKAAQRSGARWSHAGIYVGADQIVEMNYGSGLVQRSVWHHCQTRALMVRRLRGAETNRQWGDDIANAAVAHAPQKYATGELLRSKLWPNSVPNPNKLFCSTFVGMVVAAATPVQLYAMKAHRPLYPSVLANHPDLDDVPTRWCAP